jgi:hypothetical protein
MVLKRKRNLKVDVTSIYSVFLLKDLDPDELEDYTENRDTGMEADEEKEIHLQNIIKGNEQSIPLPVIREINNRSRECYKKIEQEKRKIRWEKDCSNETIASSNLTINSIANNNTITQSPSSNFNPNPVLLKIAGDNKNILTGKSDQLINYYLRRVLIRYEKQGYETYTCFRDRIFHPTFKSRRNEILMTEKISRLSNELNTLKELLKLNKEKSIENLKLIKITKKIIKKVSVLKLNKKQKKNIKRNLKEGLIKNNRLKMNVFSIMTDREKIKNIKNYKFNSELILDIKYYEDIMRLVNKK